MRRWLWLILLVPMLAGCTDAGDGDGADTSEDDLGEPDAGSGPEGRITDMRFVMNADTDSTTGLWIHDDMVLLSGGEGLRILDISDPESPVRLSAEAEGTTGSRDVDVMVHPDNGTYAVLARGSDGIAFVDITDPSRPALVSEVAVSAHNIAVVPNSTLVYNSRSISTHVPEPGTTGQIDIIDFADPADPVTSIFMFPAEAQTVDGGVKPVGATTCHDVTFETSKDWALCGGVTETHVWDISDPAAPRIIQIIDWPGTNIHHAVWSAHGGDLLILGDEMAGVAAPTPTCSDDVPIPTSALWFFDTSDLATPTPVGYFQVEHDAIQDSLFSRSPIYCSTHFGQVIHDRDMMVMGWYTAGTVLVDFSDPASPDQVAHFRPDGTNVWEARHHDGYIYTGDTGRGLDILNLI